MFAWRKSIHVFFSHRELRGQWSSGRRRRRHIDQGKAQARIAIRSAAPAIRHSSVHRGVKQYRVRQSSDQQYSGCIALCDCNLWFAIFLEDQNDGSLRRGKPGDISGCNGGQAVRLHFVMVCVRRCRKCNHPRVFLEKPQRSAVRVCLERPSTSEMAMLRQPPSKLIFGSVAEASSC